MPPAITAPGRFTRVSSHYFSPAPDAPRQDYQREVVLRGRSLTVTTSSGVYATEGLDPGTRVLLERGHQPAGRGVLLDLGCGWGPITLALAQASPGARVVGVDINARARELTAHNAAAHHLSNVVVQSPEAALAQWDGQIEEIWSNPPIRIGKQALHTLLGEWLTALVAGGSAHLVVSKNLGGDSLHRWLEAELGMATERVASAKGFRVLHTRRAE